MLTNTPRDYAWGSRSLIAALEGRPTAAAPEAEVWFGDHPSDPSDLVDGSGRTLDEWIAREGAEAGIPGRLPYLLKLLAAAAPLSIQVHPTRKQARAGRARESGLPEQAPRNYADDNHKPELLVALSDRFEALCGLREFAASVRLLETLGPVSEPLRDRLREQDAAAAIRWLLSEEAADAVDGMISALADARSTEFAAELANARRIASVYPADPGVLVALLMNYVILRRGEGVFLRAGLLHAYVAGLGVELMAASDNVLRGGLTPKHIDIDELVSILDPTPGPVPVLLPVAAGHDSRGLEAFPAPVPDFELLHGRMRENAPASFAPRGAAVILATEGTVQVASTAEVISLAAGRAVLVTPDERTVSISGNGEVFIAQPGIEATVDADERAEGAESDTPNPT